MNPWWNRVHNTQIRLWELALSQGSFPLRVAFHDKLSFVLFTGSSTQCPPSHKWAFLNGRYCCKYNEEKVNVTEGSRCDGGEISLTSSCCKEDAYTKCTHANGGCVNSGK